MLPLDALRLGFLDVFFSDGRENFFDDGPGDLVLREER